MMQATATSVGRTRIKGEIGLYLFQFLLYFSYRSFYWSGDLPDQWAQVIVNTCFDILVIFALQTAYKKTIAERSINRFLLFGLWIVFALLGSVILRYLHYLGHIWTWEFSEQFQKTFNLITFQVFDSFIVVMIGFSIGTAFQLLMNWNEARLRISELEKDNAIAEINYLRSQLNPHFVFNTLNSIFFLIQEQNDPARDALHTFSAMLRYQLYESNKLEVPIEDEIHYLENYIYLQRLRQEADTRITFQVHDNVVGLTIAPMLLIVPIENAFKHISHHSGKPNEVRVELDYSDGKLHCLVLNTREEEGGKELGGIGLGNLQRRLQLLYPDKHDLHIKETQDQYALTLTIAL